MDLLNRKFELEIEVLTPVHVGAGKEKEWAEGADFVYHDKKVYVLDIRKVIAQTGIDFIASILARRDSNGLLRKIGTNLDDLALEKFDCPIKSSNDIKVFVANGLNNKPLLPGSSLKGAIRSVLFAHLKGGSPSEKDVFGATEKGNEFMRFMKVSDMDFNRTELVNTKIFNLTGRLEGGWKHAPRLTDKTYRSEGFNTIYEVLPPGSKSRMTIALNPIGFNHTGPHFAQEKKLEIVNNGIESLFGIINQHTRNYLNKEILFFSKYSNNETPQIINCLEELKDQIPVDGAGCLLRMSAGSGFHSITGDWQHSDFSIDGIERLERISRGTIRGKKSAKSRKIAEVDGTLVPMGFVKLRLLSEAEIKLAEQEEQKRQIREAQIREQQEIEQKEQERQRILHAQQEEEMRLRQAAEEARFLQEKQQMEMVEAEREKERIAREMEEAQMRRAQQVADGLVFLQRIDSFDDAKRRIDQWLNRAQMEKIPAEQLDHLKPALIRFRQNARRRTEREKWDDSSSPIWRKINSWLEDEQTQTLFDEVKKGT
jgi:hypothetical protein